MTQLLADNKIATAQEPTTVYANPICMQMDQKIRQANTPEDVLTLLVTHRGVLFVHNLITALCSLACMCRQSVPFSVAKKLKYPDQFEQAEQERLLSDPRYTLLIRDLVDFCSMLDLDSIESIVSSMEKLNHCHYKLFGAILKRLYSMDLSDCDVSQIISVGQSLEWAGFSMAGRFYRNLSEKVTTCCHVLSQKDFINSLVLFSKIDKLYPEVMESFAKDLPLRLSSMSPYHIGICALAISEYGELIGGSASAVDSIASHMLTTSDKPNTRDLIRVAIALRRTNLRHGDLLVSAWHACLQEIREASSVRDRLEPSIATITDISQALFACAHFGIGNGTELSNLVLPFVLDNFDVVTEDSSVRLLFTVSVFNGAVNPTTAPIVSLLFRKVASSTDSWENYKSIIMSIFFTKCIQFDFIDAEFRKLVIDASLSHFLVTRRGYGIPYPETSEALFQAIEQVNVFEKVLFNEWIPSSPYHADILCPNERIAVLVLSQFGSHGAPVGPDLLQVKNIESLGWQVVAIDRRKLLNSITTEVMRITESIGRIPS